MTVGNVLNETARLTTAASYTTNVESVKTNVFLFNVVYVARTTLKI